MSNIFDSFAAKMRGSSFVLWVSVVAVTMIIIGAVHFWEDTLSSYDGILMLQNVFGIQPAHFNITYWTMSLAPQVAQIGFVYLAAVNSERRGYLLMAAIFFFVIDLVSDVQYRSGGQFMALDRTGVRHISFDAATAVSIFMTIGWFTVGSELFLTAGVGILLASFNDIISQAVTMITSTRRTARSAQIRLREATSHPSSSSRGATDGRGAQ